MRLVVRHLAILLFLLLGAASLFAQTTESTSDSSASTTTTTSTTSSTDTPASTSTTTTTESEASTAPTPSPANTNTPTVSNPSSSSSSTSSSDAAASEPAVTVSPGAEVKLPPRTGAAESAPTTTAVTPETTTTTTTTTTDSAVNVSPGGEVKLPPKTEGGDAATTQEASEGGLLTPKRTIVPPSSSGADPASVAQRLDARISLDLRSIEISDVLNYLTSKAELNTVMGSGISGVVTLLLNDVSIRDAIDIILSSNRFAYTIKDNILRVMTEEEYKGLYGKEFYDKRETKIVRLKYASPKNVGAMLEHVKSAVGRIVYDDSTGTVVMTDTPEKIAEMEEVISHEELPTIVRVPPTSSEIFDLQYAKAALISEKLAPTLSKDLGKIFVDDRSNRLIISDLPYKLDEIRTLVRAFDVKTRAVFIEAKIIHVVLSDRFQGGIDWTSFAGGRLQQTFPLNLSSFGQMTLGTIAPQTVVAADGSESTTYVGSGAIIKFLESFGKSKVISTPQIAAIDGEEAKIMVGSKEAYTTSSVTQSQATTTTAQQVTFVDVGITLRVTPTINTDGFITMKIKPEVSSVTRFLTTSQGDQIPIVESTNAETTVLVRNGATVLIGGLMGNRRIKARAGVPILSRIPIVGSLFRSTDDQASNSELSVLLTPHIIDGEETFPGTSKLSSVATVNLSESRAALEAASDGPQPPATPAVDAAGNPVTSPVLDQAPAVEEEKTTKQKNRRRKR